MFFRRKGSVAEITAQLNDIVADLEAHESASQANAAFHAGMVSEHSKHRDGHTNEAVQARRVAEKIRALIS